MDAEKYRRQITLLCPTCGSSQFSEVEPEADLILCVSCGREITREDLRRENSERIHAEVDEVKQQVVQDAAKELKEALRNAFKGSKNITIK